MQMTENKAIKAIKSMELIWHNYTKSMRRKSHKLSSEDLEPGYAQL